MRRLKAVAAPHKEEGAALAQRAPIDLRVNTLKAKRPEVQKQLAGLGVIWKED